MYPAVPPITRRDQASTPDEIDHPSPDGICPAASTAIQLIEGKMMILETFEHKGATVQIRLYDDGERFIIRATDATGKPLNGYVYSITKIDQIEAGMAANLDPLKELANTARSDVESDVWQQYLDAVSALKK
ncbi:hypothetical protein [Pandoraea sp. NPDC087047]|uniref:hypothetical protein n=1 Tax=Pandoraea sp. NPDC087047 TaxID=3364390 RepID=UPI003802CB1D